jgi:hypothetical protein
MSPRHEDDATAAALDGFALQLVRRDDVVDGRIGARLEMVGARAAGDQRSRRGARERKRAIDQLERRGPIEAHAALGRVHRLGDAEAECPQVAAIAKSRVPVDRRQKPWVGR